jgi:hypothetical protein
VACWAIGVIFGFRFATRDTKTDQKWVSLGRTLGVNQFLHPLLYFSNLPIDKPHEDYRKNQFFGPLRDIHARILPRWLNRLRYNSRHWGAAMADEPHEGREGQPISPSDLFRLKHQVGKSITWGKSDLNALEIEKLTELTREDYARIRKEYRDWHKGFNLDNTYLLVVIVLACVGAYFFVPYFWLKIVAIGIGITSFAAIAKREGHAEGYIDGYDAGHEAGIHEILGIKNEEIPEMAKMATQMKIDDMVVERMDERKAKESGNKTKP